MLRLSHLVALCGLVLASSCDKNDSATLSVVASQEARQPWLAKIVDLDECPVNVHWVGEGAPDVVQRLLANERKLQNGAVDIVAIDPLSADAFLVVPDIGEGNCSFELIASLFEDVGALKELRVSQAMGMVADDFRMVRPYTPEDDLYCTSVVKFSSDPVAMREKLHRDLAIQFAGMIGYEVSEQVATLFTFRNCHLSGDARSKLLKPYIAH